MPWQAVSSSSVAGAEATGSMPMPKSAHRVGGGHDHDLGVDDGIGGELAAVVGVDGVDGDVEVEALAQPGRGPSGRPGSRCRASHISTDWRTMRMSRSAVGWRHQHQHVDLGRVEAVHARAHVVADVGRVVGGHVPHAARGQVVGAEVGARVLIGRAGDGRPRHDDRHGHVTTMGSRPTASALLSLPREPGAVTAAVAWSVGGHGICPFPPFP